MKTKNALTGLLVLCLLISCIALPGGASDATEKNLYGYDEPITLKVGYSWGTDFTWLGGETSSDNAWVNLYKENNILLDILYEVDPSQSATKLSTAIMSGDYPDFIKLSASELSDYTNFALTGVIADITDAYEEYASDELKAYMNADGGLVLDSMRINGRLYGLPRVVNAFDSVPVMFIRQDWLDNLNLSMPTTMEEFKAVAHAFTYDDPDGNGADDTYGLAMDGVNVLTGGLGDPNAIFYAYGAYPGPDALAFIAGDEGEVTWGGTNAEGMKQALTLLQEMYSDGSLAKDFITMDSDKVFAEAGSGRCGIWFGPYWGSQIPTRDLWTGGNQNARITAGAIPTGLGETVSPFCKPSASEVYMISSKCENPEALIKLCNLSIAKICYPESDEEYIKYFGGADTSGWKCALVSISGSAVKNYDFYRYVPAAIESRDPSTLTVEQMGAYTTISKFMDTLADGTLDLQDEQTLVGLSRYPLFVDELCSYKVLDAIIQADGFTYSVYNTSPTEQMAEYAPTLKKLTVETIVKIITGESVDSYDKFLENWYALGGTEVIEDAQVWVDATQ